MTCSSSRMGRVRSFWAKFIGEAVLALVAPAVINAVNASLGTELSHLPLTPSKILEALAEECRIKERGQKFG